MYLVKPAFRFFLAVVLAVLLAIIQSACTSSSGKSMPNPEAPSLPVLTLAEKPVTTFREYSASLEGSNDIEVRPQVEGYLDRIYVDEGAYVKKGQPLFKINDRLYREQLNNAQATLAAANAALSNASINVEKLKPLVDNNVVSGIQLKTAVASQDAARATVNQAAALVQSARINLGYTLITAPVDGYVGRIPFRAGSLVSMSAADPLTVVSAVKDVHAYFSMSEKDFLQFEQQYPGKTVQDKVKNIPPVELLLADNSVFAQKGKIELVTGQFNESVGAISFRATFPNGDGLLRSGNSGRIRIPALNAAAVIIPKEATFEMQDKVVVFLVGNDNKVTATPLQIAGGAGNYYIVNSGVEAGARVVYAGFERLQDGAIIKPDPVHIDSLLTKNPI